MDPSVRHLAVALFSASLLAASPGLAASKKQVAKDLLGSEWQLESIDGAPVVEGSTPTVAFPDRGKVIGDTSCNRFGGGCEINPEKLRIELLVSSKKACAQPLMDQEKKFLRALESAERWKIDGNTLLIYCKKLEKPLRFHRRR